ncbi:MAG: hypothetical protein ACOY4R_20345 [Pseudomonadota bacterium]
MTIHWMIDSRQRLVVARTEGEVTRGDVQTFVQAVDGARAIGFRKLIDGTEGVVHIPVDELTQLVLNVRKGGWVRHSPGAIAFVASGEALHPLASVLGLLTTPTRPLRIFYDMGKARRWLDDVGPAPGR